MNKLTSLKHYKKGYVKALYGKLGRESGLNPGVLWPRKEELDHMKQYEKAFCPSLDDLIAENKAKKEAIRKARLDREEDVYKKMQALPGELEKFFAKLDDKKKEKEEWTRQREAMIEEVREILGYRVKPSDERFQQALQMKQEEELKAKRKEAKRKRLEGGLDELLAAASEKKDS